MPTNGFLTDDDRRYLRPVDHLWYSEERLIDIADARRKNEAREAKASEKWTEYSDEWMAENALLELEEIVRNGLPSVYEDERLEGQTPADAYLSDFFTNFTWDPKSEAYEIRSVLNDPRFIPVNKYFVEQLGLDLRAVLESELIDTENEA